MKIISIIKRIPKRIGFEIKRYQNQRHRYDYPSENNGWVKFGSVPVWGNRSMGTMFDPYVYKLNCCFHMVVSARKDNQLILIKSQDGKHWDRKQTLLRGAAGSWDESVSRACLLYVEDKYYLWYTGMKGDKASIGLATSEDGISYKRMSDTPVLTATQECEGLSTMNPCVLWDDELQMFRIWYSAGETYEPDVICYAESKDGMKWTKHSRPVLSKYREHTWEQYKIGGCHVRKIDDSSYIMYYIGYQNIDVARVCSAHSADGISWERVENNLLIAPTKDSWDADATYKPSVLEVDGKLYMWYNGRRGHEEYIGLATKNI